MGIYLTLNNILAFFLKSNQFNDKFLFRTVTNSGACLLNLPTTNEQPNQKYLDQFPLPGAQIWNVDDQCIRLYGTNAKFCRVI